MSKSNHRSFGHRRSSGTVTVVETQVYRSFARNALAAFYLTALVVALVSMSILADHMHPIIAAILGVLLGALVGAVVWMVVRAWPVIRIVWWWLPEIILAVAAVNGWVALTHHTSLPVRLTAVALMVGVPAAVPPVRRRIVALAWCLIVRHRLRVCFAQFITRNRAGTLPLILWARPTPVGERVWIYLRPGLSESDLQNNLDKIAVACHARTVTVERSSTGGTAAYLRVNIKRREVLNGNVTSPLPKLVGSGNSDRPHTPAVTQAPTRLPTALDLPDVPTTPPTGKGDGRTTSKATSAKPAPATTPATPAGDTDDDITQWI